MPKRYRYGQRFGNYNNPLSGAIWLIGLGILFYSGHIWPGILILVGINLVLSAVWKTSEPQPALDDTISAPAPIPDEPKPAAPVMEQVRSPMPAADSPRVESLPGNCPRCGAPVRPHEVNRVARQAVMCAYCGSNLLSPTLESGTKTNPKS